MKELLTSVQDAVTEYCYILIHLHHNMTNFVSTASVNAFVFTWSPFIWDNFKRSYAVERRGDLTLWITSGPLLGSLIFSYFGALRQKDVDILQTLTVSID